MYVKDHLLHLFTQHDLKNTLFSFSSNLKKKSNICELSISLYCTDHFQKLDLAVYIQPYFVNLQIGKRNKSRSQCRIKLSIVSTNAMN